MITLNPDYRIAKAPIKVYKLMLKDKDAHYKTICGYEKHIAVGDVVTARNSASNIERINEIYCINGEGVHAFVSLDAAKYSEFSYDVITEWEIPIGAKYWLGDRSSKGQIAATEMKFVKVCQEKGNY